MINLERYPNVEWVLPLLFQYEPVYGAFINLFNQQGIKFPKCELFGSPKCRWTGGRISAVTEPLTEHQLHKIFKYVQHFGSRPTLTFSNIDLTKEDLKDDYCNMITDIALQYNGSFIVSSDILMEHLRNKGAKTVKASVIRSYFDLFDVFDPETELKYYNELMKKYDIVVVRPEFSKKYLINGYDDLDISKVEVLLNQICTAYCRQAKEHYRNAQGQIRTPFLCRTKYLYCDMEANEYKSLIHYPEHVNKLIELGVNKLKLNGRGMKSTYYHIFYLIYNQMFNIEGDCLRLIYTADSHLEYTLHEFAEYMQV